MTSRELGSTVVGGGGEEREGQIMTVGLLQKLSVLMCHLEFKLCYE